MATINSIDQSGIFRLYDKISDDLTGCRYLEEAAQRFTEIIYGELSDSIALTRLFVTVPFRDLPPANRRFVTKLAASTGISSLIREETSVLSLLGTQGEKPAWNSRHDSEGHVGIPLASADFVEEIPMVSRLLHELGLGLDWIDSADATIVSRKIGKMAGVFHVEDAKNSVDNRHRKIIAAQDFVEAHKIKTVFGVGGTYLYFNAPPNTFIVNINFTRHNIPKRQAELFMSLINVFKTKTVNLHAASKIFAEG